MMVDLLFALVVAGVALFAVYRTFPSDHPFKKAAVVIVAALAAVADRILGVFGG